MIVMQLKGGLGNQMFQYALGRRLALARKSHLWLDVSCLEGDKSAFPRSYGLNAFRIRASRVITMSRLSKSEKFWLRLCRPQEVAGKADHDLQDIPPGRSLKISGYWQREEYFTAIGAEIRRDFQLKKRLTPERQKISTQFDARSVSIHVRRGDYAAIDSYTAFFGTCQPEWYESAMSFVEARVKAPRFFVFSDDPHWARDNLPLQNRWAQFVAQSDNRDFEDLHLMSRCAHHIIANSSFSWWAAWLDPSPTKIVVAPKVWYKGAPEWPVHVLPSWVRL